MKNNKILQESLIFFYTRSFVLDSKVVNSHWTHHEKKNNYVTFKYFRFSLNKSINSVFRLFSYIYHLMLKYLSLNDIFLQFHSMVKAPEKSCKNKY